MTQWSDAVCTYCDERRPCYREGECVDAPICRPCAEGACDDNTATPDVRAAVGRLDPCAVAR